MAITAKKKQLFVLFFVIHCASHPMEEQQQLNEEVKVIAGTEHYQINRECLRQSRVLGSLLETQNKNNDGQMEIIVPATLSFYVCTLAPLLLLQQNLDKNNESLWHHLGTINWQMLYSYAHAAQQLNFDDELWSIIILLADKKLKGKSTLSKFKPRPKSENELCNIIREWKMRKEKEDELKRSSI